MNTMNMPGFTAESALSITGRGYRLPRVGRSTAAPGVRPALMNVGGGGSGFWCDDSTGTCSCLGGSLSVDCWLMQQYCTSPLYCSPYSPYKCSCYYTLTRPPQIGRGNIGTIGTRIKQSN
jgi:hypothetical protein